MDIGNYVDRYMANYIVYHRRNFVTRGDLGRAEILFDATRQNELARLGDSMKESALRAQADAIAARGGDIGAELNIVSGLQSGVLLEDTMDRIAAGINESIERFASSTDMDIDNLRAQARTLKRGFTSGSIDAKTVNEFFDLIYEGLRMANVSYRGTNLLLELTDVGRTLTMNNNFMLSDRWQEEGDFASYKDMQIADEISRRLQRAADVFRSHGGTLSSQAFIQLVDNIFRDTIGDQLVKIGVYNSVTKGMKYIEQQLNKAPNITLKDGTRDEPIRLGEPRAFIDNEGIRMSVSDTNSGESFNISIMSKGDLRLGGSFLRNVNAGQRLPQVNYGGFYRPGEEKYLAYNIIVHGAGAQGENFLGAYQKLRGMTAARYFADWLRSAGGVGLASFDFIVIDRKVYSLERIIKNMCDEIARNDNWENDLGGLFDAKEGLGDSVRWAENDDDPPSTVLAMKRSKAVNDVINNFTIGSTLNYNMLKKYAY